jgi:hypothetical protein
MAAAMGMNVQLPAGTNPSQQQAYNEAMHAIAMQQAAALAGGHPISFFPQVFAPVAMTSQPAAAAPADANQQQQSQQQQQQQQEQPQQSQPQSTEPQQG